MSDPSPIDSWRVLQALGAYSGGGPEVVQAKVISQGAVNSNQRVGLVALFYPDGTPFNIQTFSALGSIPVLSGVAIGLTTSLTSLSASWWCLNPANWPAAPAGRTLQYRLVVTANALTNGDVVAANLYDTTAGADVFSAATATKVSSSATTQLASPWQTFPTTVKGGYIIARNQTAARGTIVSAFIEVRIA